MSEALLKPEKLDAQVLLGSFQEAWQIVQKRNEIERVGATDEVFVLDALYTGLRKPPLYERSEDIPEVQYEELARKSLNTYIQKSKSLTLEYQLKEINRSLHGFLWEKVIIKPVDEEGRLTTGKVHKTFGFVEDDEPGPKRIKGRIYSLRPSENYISVVSRYWSRPITLAVLDSDDGQPLAQIEFPNK